jgi:hypothetical protein
LSGVAAKRTKAAPKRKKKVVNLSIDLDELERLYRRIHGLIAEGDTKLRRLRLSDGDTKEEVFRVRRVDGDTKGEAVRPRRRKSGGDTKGGSEPAVRPRRRKSGGDTKGGSEPGVRPRRRKSGGDTKGGSEPGARRRRARGKR